MNPDQKVDLRLLPFPTPVLLMILAVAFAMLMVISIRQAKRKRRVFIWQDEVVPEWSNISDAEFDELKHHLRAPRHSAQSRRIVQVDVDELEQTEETAETQTDREDVVYIVCRRHYAAGLPLIPVALLFLAGFVLTVFLARIEPVSNSISRSIGATGSPWYLGTIVMAGAAILGLRVLVEWRYVYYMLTNKAVHIIKQPPLWLAFWPGMTRRLPLVRVTSCDQDETVLGNALDYITVKITSNRQDKEDAPFNNMPFVPVEAEFDDHVNALIFH